MNRSLSSIISVSPCSQVAWDLALNSKPPRDRVPMWSAPTCVSGQDMRPRANHKVTGSRDMANLRKGTHNKDTTRRDTRSKGTHHKGTLNKGMVSRDILNRPPNLSQGQQDPPEVAAVKRQSHDQKESPVQAPGFFMSERDF